MNQALGERTFDWMAGLLEPIRNQSDDTARSADANAANGPTAANDLTSVRIQSLAGRGLIDPKSLRLREIQELSASIVAHIRQQHGR